MRQIMILIVVFLLLFSGVALADKIERNKGSVGLSFVSLPHPKIIRQTGIEKEFTYKFKKIGKNQYKTTICHKNFKKNKNIKGLDTFSVKTTTKAKRGSLEAVNKKINLKDKRCQDVVISMEKGDIVKFGEHSTDITLTEDNITFIVTPEYANCDYLFCKSEIIIHNDGVTDISFNSSDLSISLPANIYTTKTYTEQEEIMSCPTEVCTGIGTYQNITKRELRNIDENFLITLAPDEEIRYIIHTTLLQPNKQYKYDVNMFYLGETHTLDPYFVTSGTGFTGTFINTSLNASGFVQLDNGYSTGTYTSQIYDSNRSSSSWLSMTWNSSIYGRALPDYTGTDIDDPYAINMSDNVLLMHLDETSGTLKDYSGQGHNGNTVTGTYAQDGIINKSFEVMGSSSDIITIIEDDMGYTDVVSYGAWFKLNTLPTYSGVISRLYTWPDGYGLAVGTSPRIACTGGGVYTGTTITPKLNRWYHAACVYNGTTMSLYVDGEFIKSTSITLTPAGSNRTTLGSFYSSGALVFDGVIDEAFIFHKAISSSDVENIFSRGIARLNMSIRACNASDCSDASFIDIGLPKKTFNYTARYFQYKALFYNIEANNTARLLSTKIEYAEGCEEDWEAVYGLCQINDSRQKTYTDLNHCGTTDYLPGDNGTYISCNYCTQDIIYTQSLCAYNGTGFFTTKGYIDKKYSSCCAVTNITSDCGINYAPYNETETEPCTKPTEENLYFTLAAILVAIIFLLFMFADRLDFFYLKSKNGQDIPFIKYLVWLVSAWLLVALAGIGIHLAELGDVALLPMFTSIYKALIAIMIFITALWLISFLAEILKMFGFLGGFNKNE